MDQLDGFEQPRCPECGTVLRDVPRGYECGHCGLTFLPNLENTQTPQFQRPLTHGANRAQT